MWRATGTVVQKHNSRAFRLLLDDCLTITYSAVHYGHEEGIYNKKGMKGFYQTLKNTGQEDALVQGL
jgi:hypothetical protein